MTIHLTTEQIESYVSRSISRNELTTVNEHLFSCETCYQELLHILQERRFPLEIDLDELAGSNTWHIEGEELKAYVEGRMYEIDLEYANLHLEECAWCREEVTSYSEFINKLPYYLSKRHAPLKKPAVWNRYYGAISGSPLRAAAAALVFILVSATILWFAWRTEVQNQGNRLAEIPQPESPLVTHAPPPPQPNLSEQAINHEGAKAGGATKSPSKRRVLTDQQETETELITRALIMPPVIEQFDRSPVVLRGNGSHGESFNVIAPYSTVIIDDRPTFRWTALSGAASYTVSVYDDKLNLFEKSGPLTGTQWPLPRRLKRGVIYTWIVTALKDDKEVLAPSLPARAEFKIIEKAEWANLNRITKNIHSNAARAVLYAKAGLLDKAEHELRAHLTSHPADNTAKRILETIKSWRFP